MGDYVNFFGFGVEVGQERIGPAVSHRYARQYFEVLKHLGVNIIDRGEVFLQPEEIKIKIKNSQDIQKFDWSSYKKAYNKIQSLLKSRTKLVNWGGDHSIALSTVGAFCSQCPEGYVLWIDAHGDLNLPSQSPTGNLHGMPLSILLNLEDIQKKYFPWLEQSLKPQNLIYLGLRDLDPFEKKVIEELKIKKYLMSDIRWSGMPAVAQEILDITAGQPLHVSFDIDSMDPSVAPSTGIPVPNGLLMKDLKNIGQALSKHQDIRSIDIVEVNPLLGTSTQIEQTFLTAFVLLVTILSQGEANDGISRSDQAFYAAQMEPGL